VPVRDPAFQNAIKKGIPFFRRAICVTPYKLKHCLLNQIKSFSRVPGSKFGHLESPSFNISQKSV
jgi:hypothetical protein